MSQGSKKINLGYFLLGILYLIVSLLAFRNPTGSLLSIAIVFGITFIIKGIYEILFSKRSFLLILVSIIDIMLGILLITKIGVSLVILPYIFSISFIANSIFGVFTSSMIKGTSKFERYFLIVLNILGIFAGIFLLYNPISSVLTLTFIVGAYFMMVGIQYFFAAFNLS